MFGRQGPARLRLDDSITRQKIKPGTVKRIIPYVKHYRWSLTAVMALAVLDAVLTISNPLLLRLLIDNGILKRQTEIVVELALTIGGLALLNALGEYIQTWYSARVGQGLVYNLRTEVFGHIQRQPPVFFTRSQTGSLVSRLNTDVVGAQQAVTSLLSDTISTVLTLIFALATMFYLSWQITLVALAMIPLLLLPGRLIGKRLQRLTREQMLIDAEIGSIMNERFNIAGSMLAMLYGNPDTESDLFARKAARARGVTVVATVSARAFFIIMTLLAALITSLMYGVGGFFVINGGLKLGTLVAMLTLLARLYGPINQLSGMQVNVITALVSFDRVFELLDVKPLITERPDATALPPVGGGAGTAPTVDLEHVWFRYPAASDVSPASLESIALPKPEISDTAWVLRDVSLYAPAGKLTALVGPSGAGKSTITHLIPRLYDPGSGVVRIGGRDIRDATLRSLRETIGVVTQDAHLFHDTIRANLTYACPDALEDDLVEACKAAQIWDLVASLPDRMDTVVGDRGYRLSGGEKQRVALARLLLKAPAVVVLDEATAHLDSESETAVQQALRTALAGRTAIVIAHRLSTIQEAHQILVIDHGQVTERGTHEDLLAEAGSYSSLYNTQFARQYPR